MQREQSRNDWLVSTLKLSKKNEEKLDKYKEKLITSRDESLHILQAMSDKKIRDVS